MQCIMVGIPLGANLLEQIFSTENVHELCFYEGIGYFYLNILIYYQSSVVQSREGLGGDDEWVFL